MKKFITVLVLIMMVFTLAGCGSKEEKAEETAEVKSIVLRGSGPLTGGAALYGTAVQRGAQIAVDEINEKEGYAFFDYKLEDDAHDPETAVNAFYKMLDDGMQVSLLCTTSAPAASVAPLLQDEDIFAITPSSSRDDVPAFGNNIFQMCFKDSNQGKASAQYITEKFGKEAKVGVIYQSSVDYSKGIYNTFAAEAKAQGLNIVAEESFTDENDYNVQIGKVKEAGAEVVFLPIYYDEASMILTQAGDYKPVWFGVDGMDGILGKEGFDTYLAEGTYLLTPFDATSTEAKSKAFTDSYVAKYGETPMQFAADSYDAVYAIYNACKAGGVSADMTNSEISEILRAQFTSMTFEGVTGTGTWDASGEISKSPMCVVIKDGAYATVE